MSSSESFPISPLAAIPESSVENVRVDAKVKAKALEDAQSVLYSTVPEESGRYENVAPESSLAGINPEFETSTGAKPIAKKVRVYDPRMDPNVTETQFTRLASDQKSIRKAGALEAAPEAVSAGEDVVVDEYMDKLNNQHNLAPHEVVKEPLVQFDIEEMPTLIKLRELKSKGDKKVNSQPSFPDKVNLSDANLDLEAQKLVALHNLETQPITKEGPEVVDVDKNPLAMKYGKLEEEDAAKRKAQRSSLDKVNLSDANYDAEAKRLVGIHNDKSKPASEEIKPNPEPGIELNPTIELSPTSTRRAEHDPRMDANELNPPFTHLDTDIAPVRRGFVEPRERNSIIDKIDDANWATDRRINLEEYGRERNWFRTAFNKLSIKMGWIKDIFNYGNSQTINKVAMGNDNYWNNRMINRKKEEISKVEGKIKKLAGNNNMEKKMSEENVRRVDSLIEEAKKRGDTGLMATLEETRSKLINETGAKRGQLELEKASLKSQLERYSERKVAILDNFVASVEIKTERIRNQEDYYENVRKRTDLNYGIEKSQEVISLAESELIGLKKALAFNKDPENRATIKESIREYKQAIKDSRVKRRRYERVAYRLSKFIDYTDKRTQKFDNLRNTYVIRRNNVISRNNGIGAVGPAEVPASKKVEPEKKKKEVKAEPVKVATTAPESSAVETVSSTETPDGEGEGEIKADSTESSEARVKKIDIIKKTVKEFGNIIMGDSDNAVLDPTIKKRASELLELYKRLSKDKDFKDAEYVTFQKGVTQVGGFLKQMEKDGDSAKLENKQKMRKSNSEIEKVVKELK